MSRVTTDFETRSMADLRKVGAYKYSLDPTTRPTCMAFKTQGSRTYLLKFETINKQWKDLPSSFRQLWQSYINSEFPFVAHNAFFEQCIYYNILVKRYGWPGIPRRMWRCTAAKAAACALPRSLEGAADAMELPIRKDKRGYSAMMATCKPTKQWNAWRKLQDQVKSGARISAKRRAKADEPEPPVFLEPHMNPETWNTLYTYCKIDVEVEELLDNALPDLSPEEQEVWFLNQKINWRGLRIDIPTVRKIVGILAKESGAKLKELDSITMGLVTKPGARQSILDFLKLEGIELPDIRAKTVEDVLKDGDLSEDMRRLLEIRKQLSKTSTKKYQSFLDRAGKDGRVRDILLYNGASTGRDTGTGIQPHNFPRGVIKISSDRPYAAVENVISCDAEMLKLLYGDNLAAVFSSILRNMILPSEGCELFVADFSKIEVAVLWWLADNKPGLKILNSGKDPYRYMAAANTGKSYEDIPGEGDDRQLGKAQVLGCGFGMGWKKFRDTAYDQYRLKLTAKQSKDAVKAYREANEAVPALWEGYEKAAIAAIENRKVYTAGKCKFFCSKGFLWVELPSGRKLSYRKPKVGWRTPIYDVDEYFYKGQWRRDVDDVDEKILAKCKHRIAQVEGRPRKTMEFLGLALSKKTLVTEITWGGTLTENIVQAVARDLMKHGEKHLDAAGYSVLLSVHDELLCEKEFGKGSVPKFVKTMCRRPPWADKNLPIDAKGWAGPRYKK